ncbi:hypothetical protein O7602_26145 [Micromonospora sp. WMMD1128]|uniref:hypothetical protein n=1 Tax=unclassified Micromonospora TaxID=2617518 RepID=UPI00248C8153|nr:MULTISPECIES: hypothetical protein [unclassified Micromonospora]WBB77176.1 hypothetical protein O7602_26145 [Micromonospora sp. WMMD1128]WFE33413.1 hypothetical protein O7613_28490 [Micromonospora sp. WMMD975]
MAKKDRSREREPSDQERREQELEGSPEWADRAASARTPDDPRAMAPRDAGGRPSNGRQF